MIPAIDLARLSAAAYSANPAPGVRRITFQDISADIVGTVCAVRGTSSYATLRRDMLVIGRMCVDHPAIGACQAGALTAAQGLFNQIPSTVDTFTGHSEGGCIAAILAGLWGHVGRLVTWDAPKAGGALLVAALRAWDVTAYRFSCSVVTDWPLLLDRQVKPLVTIGEWTWDVVEAHSINRAVGWMGGAR